MIKINEQQNVEVTNIKKRLIYHACPNVTLNKFFTLFSFFKAPRRYRGSQNFSLLSTKNEMLDYSRIFLIKSPTRKQWQLRPLWSRSNNVVSLQWKKKKIECLLRKYHRDAGHIFWSKKRRRCWEKTSIHRGNERPKAKRGLKFGGGEELCGTQRVRAVYRESG